MTENKKRRLAAGLLACLLLTGCGVPDVSAKINALYEEGYQNTMEQKTSITEISASWKEITACNPISPDIYCADPTCVEYNGRLYVYGTNDHQQHDEGTTGSNTYEAIKSMVVFSTDDMVNWTYHGIIPVGEIAPWIISSWAPSVVSRVESDGLTHFYLYFSNNGCGVGVITSTDPVTGWTDPLGKPLIQTGMQGLRSVPNPFDPGAVIDENGTGWLSFGGGIAANGSGYMPNTSRIVQLGEDMLSFASDFAPIPAPYFYEASELNYIGGNFVYTYNSNWDDRIDWDFGGNRPGKCSMIYMSTKTPLDGNSWLYWGDYFANPQEFGYPSSNNHTHLHKFQDKWYLFYHTLQREAGVGEKGGFRSLCAAPATVDEEKGTIAKVTASDEGAPQSQPFNPFILHAGATLATDADMHYVSGENGAVTAIASDKAGAYLAVRGADLRETGAGGFAAEVRGSGTIEIRLDAKDGEALGSITFDCGSVTGITGTLSKKAAGTHDLYLVFSDADIELHRWMLL